ncbi:eukaryotic translation initiation factor 4E-like [Rhipicephalus microplus]|uniref:eukaryotic translation initiation factor 4E-like n=1 Tax=Rhipicephalus microplus TaxID=6941 RepID=UPI003F6BD072
MAGPVKKAPRPHPPLHSIKHPLQHRWSVWYYNNDKKRSWQESQIEVASFDTVEDFWALFTHLEVASKLRRGCEYSLFEYGIKPMWEDSRNQNEGRWLFSLNKSHRTTDLDNYWLEIEDIEGEAIFSPTTHRSIPGPFQYTVKEGRYVKS